ncbi:MAG: biosynthetic arginine decarboxylase [Desulfoarculaceae bacterium]|nr:biosynthetic arginine decarboxylase [Desulfoarculaceae bacterium]
MSNDRALIAAENSDRYHVSHWGNGYFAVNSKGHLCVLPEKRTDGPTIDFLEVIEEIKNLNISFPAVLRFHDILRSQVRLLNTTFRAVIEECEYQGQFLGVYPVKVNQMREVVEEIIDAGQPFDYGLEAGSKPELLAALALNDNRNALTILNGYKDEDYIRLALLGRRLGRKIIIVVERFSEFALIIRLAKELGVEPMIGIRAKLAAHGTGRWAGASGEKGKFGLTCSEILSGVALLRQEGMAHCLKLLHFHVGSQIPDIRFIKEAIAEAGRIFVDLVALDLPLEYFDVGGGLGVDYDGSRSTSDSSRNYTLEDYAFDIIDGLQYICDQAGVAHPHIVSESGRFVTAHHSCVITNVIDNIHQTRNKLSTEREVEEHNLVSTMRGSAGELDDSNYQAIFNDIQQCKDDSISAFRFGVISIGERAKIETLYWTTLARIQKIAEGQSFIPEELQRLGELQASQYLCNFSIFQSAADTWAIKQLLPIMPVMRLDEQPDVRCSLVDITCDSDGKIDRFIAKGGYEKTLLLHTLQPGEEYYIGLFLTGAYQDVMGDMHNLFGRLNEVHIYCDDDDPNDFYIEEMIKGSSAQQVLTTMQYNPELMARTIKKEIDRQVQQGKILPREGVRLVDFYENCLADYTYLKI